MYNSEYTPVTLFVSACKPSSDFDTDHSACIDRQNLLHVQPRRTRVTQARAATKARASTVATASRACVVTALRVLPARSTSTTATHTRGEKSVGYKTLCTQASALVFHWKRALFQ